MNKKGQKRNSLLFFGSVFVFVVGLSFFSACSSAPEKATEIIIDRNTATKQLNIANQMASHGRYEEALFFLGEARRLAVSTDDPSLRIRTSISLGNILFSTGRHDEAFENWEIAAAEGDSSREPILAALARIFIIRGSIMRLTMEEQGNTAAAVEEYRNRLAVQTSAVRSDQFASAAGYITLGLAEKELGRWAEAESTVRRALDIHEKNMELEDAAYAWFLIASIRSVAGNHDLALEALARAISFDRRAENGFGLASSWQAIGDVYGKTGRTEESMAAWLRAVEIYRAINMNELAEKVESRL